MGRRCPSCTSNRGLPGQERFRLVSLFGRLLGTICTCGILAVGQNFRALRASKTSQTHHLVPFKGDIAADDEPRHALVARSQHVDLLDVSWTRLSAYNLSLPLLRRLQLGSTLPDCQTTGKIYKKKNHKN